MKQATVGGYYTSTTGDLTKYSAVANGYNWHTDPIYKGQIVTSPGTFSDLLIELSTAPGAGKSYTFTLIKNGEATGVAVTISNTDTQGSSTGSAAVAAGDIIMLRSVPSVDPPATSRVRQSILFEGDNAKESLVLGMCDACNVSINYFPISAGDFYSTQIENRTYQIIPTSGKLKNLYVALTQDPGVSPEAYRFTLRKNGESTALTVTVTADDTTGNDTEHEVIVAAGDYVNLMVEPLNSPSVEPDSIRLGLTFVADTDGESLLLGNSSDEPSAAATEFNFLATTRYSIVWKTTEADRYQIGQPTTLKKLYARLSTSPGAGKNYLIGVRVNGSTKLSVTIADAAIAGSDLVNTWEVADYDHLNMISTPDGTPAVGMIYWGLVGFIEPSGWSGKISGVTNPAKVMGVDVANIAKVKGVASA